MRRLVAKRYIVVRSPEPTQHALEPFVVDGGEGGADRHRRTLVWWDGVRPDDVQISCVKTGYKQIKINRRTPPGGTAMFIETECTMQRL